MTGHINSLSIIIHDNINRQGKSMTQNHINYKIVLPINQLFIKIINRRGKSMTRDHTYYKIVLPIVWTIIPTANAMKGIFKACHNKSVPELCFLLNFLFQNSKIIGNLIVALHHNLASHFH